jgi:glutathione peroxidase
MSLITTARGYSRRVGALTPRHDVYRHRLTLIDGELLDLVPQHGRPALIVNTASQCSFAGQLFGLQSLHARYAASGLLVIACPSGDFAGLELEDPNQIAHVYRDEYEAEFAVTEPMSVRVAPDALWHDLAAQPGAGAPVWSFNKYLIDADGRVRTWYSTNVQPHHLRIREAIEALLPG